MRLPPQLAAEFGEENDRVPRAIVADLEDFGGYAWRWRSGLLGAEPGTDELYCDHLRRHRKDDRERQYRSEKKTHAHSLSGGSVRFHAAIGANNLCELRLTLGEVFGAIEAARQSVTYADLSGDALQRMGTRTTLADALNQAGRSDESRRFFAQAEQLQAEDQPQHPRLYSIAGFLYCDVLLSWPERDAWRIQLAHSLYPASSDERSTFRGHRPESVQACLQVLKRATHTRSIAERNNWLLPVALDHLTLGRAALYLELLNRKVDKRSTDEEGNSEYRGSHSATDHLATAVEGLRQAGMRDHLPRGLLTLAWQRWMAGDTSGAMSDLDEGWDIAIRGPMPLHQADILLARTRLFFRDDFDAAWRSLTEARRLIEQCGYHRREEELADTEEALHRWSY